MNVAGLGDGSGELLGFVALRKQCLTDKGKIWSGVSVKNSFLEGIAKNFVEKTQWSGPFELEFKVSEGEFYLLEINPRFPAWIYFSAGVGVNLPHRLVKLLLDGECESGSDYAAGKMFMRYTDEVIVDVADMARIHNTGVSYVKEN